MMTKIKRSAFAAGLLALLVILELGYATDPNQAGLTDTQENPDPRRVTPKTIPGVTEWLSIHQKLFSKHIEPANALSEEIVLALSQRVAVIESGQDFKTARRCLQNPMNHQKIGQMVRSQDCLIQIGGFLEALEERAHMEATLRALGLLGEGQSVLEQLADLWRLDEPHVCQIQSLTHVRDLVVFYQQSPNLRRYIWSQLGKRREHCLALFAASLSDSVNQLRSSQPIFQLLQKIQLRLGQGYNQPVPPFVYIHNIIPDSVYDAVESEIGSLNHLYSSNVADLEIQRVVVHELRRLCSLIVPNNVASYFNQFMYILGIVHLTPITMINLSMNTRHLPKFEICNMILDNHFPIARALDEIDQINLYEAQMEMVPPGVAIHDNSQELMPSQNIYQAMGQPVDTMALPGTPRVESEDFYVSLASAVAENYQRDSGIGPTGSLNSDRDH